MADIGREGSTIFLQTVMELVSAALDVTGTSRKKSHERSLENIC